ncbi:MAG: D-aminoacyl-tRNA deacylase [Gemmatimonadota bacterium]
MRAVLQRVREASVSVAWEPRTPEMAEACAAGEARTWTETARIGRGLLVLVGFGGGETPADLDWAADKVLALRIFGAEGGFDRSVVEMESEILVVSQFTLLAGLYRGRRPDFAGAATAGLARPLYDGFVERLERRHQRVRQGVFGVRMRVALVNDGPATFVLERG